MFPSSAVDRGMGSSPDRVKPKSMQFVFVASPLTHAALSIKSKDCLAWNQINVIAEKLLI